jgi:hypothetical protein
MNALHFQRTFFRSRPLPEDSLHHTFVSDHSRGPAPGSRPARCQLHAGRLPLHPGTSQALSPPWGLAPSDLFCLHSASLSLL